MSATSKQYLLNTKVKDADIVLYFLLAIIILSTILKYVFTCVYA